MASIDDRRWATRRDPESGERKKVRTGYNGPKPWRARYRTSSGEQRSQCFARKVDAERFLTSVEHQRLSGAYVDPTAGRATFEAYAESWRGVQVHRETTAAQVESHLRLHVYPVLGPLPLAAIRPSHVQGLIKSLAESLAPSTVETIYRHVAAIFRAAVRDRVLPLTPCAGISLPKPDRDHKVVPLELDQVQAVADGMPDRWRATVWLAAGTGLRQGEVLGLTVDRLDFLRRTVKVDRQLVTPGKGAPRLAPPKTRASYRTVPLPESVAVVLAEHMRSFPPADDGLIFSASDGRPVRRQRLADAWRKAADAVGLDVGFHATRHFYASLLIRHGESVKTVQHRLGHASATETLDTYGHLWPDSDDRTRQAVDAVLGSASCVTPVSRLAL